MTSEQDIIKSVTTLRAAKYGARFFRIDLHFHTPASEDARGKNKYNFNPFRIDFPPQGASYPQYYEKVMEIQAKILEDCRNLARKMVKRFVEKKLNLVAVTDHNGIGTLWNDPEARPPAMDLAAPTWYELIDDESRRVNKEAGRTVLKIMPGVEISTSDIHILGIFPPQVPRRKVHFIICDLLNEAGFAVEEWGKNPKVGRSSVYNTIELIAQKGGLPIIAHADAHEKALFKLYKIKSGAMRDVLTNPHLAAIEIVESSTFEQENRKVRMPLSIWINRQRKKQQLPPLAFSQGSDAHSLTSIAQRFTYIKMTEPSYSGVKTAVQIPTSRVRFGDDFQKLRRQEEGKAVYLYGLELHHPYFGNASLRFNRYLNCVAGKLDSGKSTLFHLIQIPFAGEKATKSNHALKSEVRLFIEKIEYSREAEFTSTYYAIGQERGKRYYLFSLEKDGEQFTAAESDWQESKHLALAPFFYDPGVVNPLIATADSFSDFLIKRFGTPSAQTITNFNKTFAIPILMTRETRQLLKVEIQGGRYTLRLDTRWNQGKKKWVEFSKLDNSLKRVVLISIFIVCGLSGPLIIDAPEEYFNNEDIVHFLIPLIKTYKDLRQIILFTNHPLLAINTDPENYILLERKGNKTRMESGFSIDDPGQKTALIDLMEGSIGMFNQRSLRYGNWETI